MFSDAQMKLSLTSAASSEAKRNMSGQYGAIVWILPRPILPRAFTARERRSGEGLSRKAATAGTASGTDRGWARPASPSSQSAFARIFSDPQRSREERYGTLSSQRSLSFVSSANSL